MQFKGVITYSKKRLHLYSLAYFVYNIK